MNDVLPKTAAVAAQLKGQINPLQWERIDKEVEQSLKKACASIMAYQGRRPPARNAKLQRKG